MVWHWRQTTCLGCRGASRIYLVLVWAWFVNSDEKKIFMFFCSSESSRRALNVTVILAHVYKCFLLTVRLLLSLLGKASYNAMSCAGQTRCLQNKAVQEAGRQRTTLPPVRVVTNITGWHAILSSGWRKNFIQNTGLQQRVGTIKTVWTLFVAVEERGEILPWTHLPSHEGIVKPKNQCVPLKWETIFSWTLNLLVNTTDFSWILKTKIHQHHVGSI